MFLADLHVHSRFSDGRLTIAELVDFYGQRGFGAIAITDHLCESRTVMGVAARYMKITLTLETFGSYMATLRREGERAWDQYRMVVIPGFELTKNSFINHRSAHILGLGIREFVGAEGQITQLTRAIRNQGALAVAAHPVPTNKAEIQTLHLWSRREELREEFDAWEVASGKDLFPQVARSGLPLLATSDFHRPRDISGYKTVFQCERNAEAILEAVRAQNLEFRYYEDHPALAPVPGFGHIQKSTFSRRGQQS